MSGKNSKPVDICKPNKKLGPLDHLVVVRGDRATGRVEALVTFFGHVQVCVRLATLGDLDESFVTTYRVDQLGRRDRLNHPHDCGISVRNFTKVAASSHAERFKAVERSIRKILEHMKSGEKNEESFEPLLRECWDATIGPPDGGVITEDKANAFCEMLAERFVGMLQEQGLLEMVAAPILDSEDPAHPERWDR